MGLGHHTWGKPLFTALIAIAPGFLGSWHTAAATGPTITNQPQSQSVLAGANAVLTVGATGQTPLFYQWLFNGADLTNSSHVSGATNVTLTISNVAAADGGNYQAIVSNSHGSVTSSNATLVVLIPPWITLQPANQVATLSGSASLTVGAGGTTPLSYQWYFNGAPLANGGRISGAGTPLLTITNVQWTDAGMYQVVVTNLYGIATSRTAVLGTSPGTAGSVRFVSLNSSNSVPPYTDWSLAATNIQDTVDASSDGDFIFVADGIYRSVGRPTGDGNTNCVVTTNAVTIQSVHGAIVTLLDGGSLMRCANLSNGAVLIGFTLTNGSAGYGGGAVGGTLEECWLAGNSGGGAYYSVLNDCTVVSNRAIGVAYSALSNCVVNGNSGSGAGGCTLDNCRVQNNNASGWEGGGANQCTLNNCLLSGNIATYGGGAASSTLNACVLSNNTASWGGGAISSTLNNCLVVANMAHNHYVDFYAASLGGGVWGGTANNCTISGNTVAADENSAGRYYSGGGAYGTVLNNSIIYFNSEAPYTHDNAYNYGSGTLSNCCTTPLTGSGNDNLTSDPLLVNPGGGDYRLQTNSPCINGGNNAFVVGTSDLDGNSRIVGLVADMGAYEFQWPTYFTVQPQSQTVNAGATVVFSAAATGPLPFVYQWLVNGVAIAGANSSTLALTNVQLADDGAYSVTVSNATVLLFSTNAMLSVIYPAPAIVTQPTSLTVLAGTPVQLSVTVTSQVAVTYQWLLDGTNLADGGNVGGSTNSVLNILPAQGTNSGDYQVIAMNAFGAVTSAVATLTVLVPANIVTQPASQSVVLTNPVSFTVVAAGTAPLSYQWYFHGAPLADTGRLTGSKAPTLNFSTTLTNDAGSYQLVVTNNYGPATSQVATLTVLLPPFIIAQPTNQTVQPGSNVTLAVVAVGPVPLGYQWLLNGANLTDGGRISGSATSQFSIQNAQATDNGIYQVLVTNTNGVTASTPALLTVLTPPAVTRQPPNLFEPVNGGAVLTVGADGAPPLSYQWYFNGAASSDNARVSGSLTSALSISTLQTNDQGSYQVVVTNAYGSATSAVASLRVLLTPVSPSGVVAGWGRDDVNEIDFPGDATNIVALAAGYIHALALRADGTVEAWGESYLGATSVPSGLSNVVAIAGGDNHSLALKNDGTVVAWGYNGYGEATVPSGLSNVVAIAAGDFFSLALRSDGTVTGWGDNGNGQLTQAGVANNIIAIAANPVNVGYALGLRANGTVVQWGTYAPPMPGGLTNVVNIAVGGGHYLALKNDGTVVAWGDNSSGQTNVPAGLSNAVAIAAGWKVSLALKADGTVMVWGDSGYGDGINPLGLTHVTAVASGGGFNLALNNGTPSLVFWPTNQAVYTGMPLVFNSGVVSEPVASSVQWQFNHNNLPGATGAVLSLTNAQLTDAGTYSVVVTNAYGTVEASALLAVSTSAPVLVQQPTNQVVAASSNAVFVAGALGSWPLSYQWQCSNTNLPGATDSTLVVTNAQMNQSGLSFDVVVTNAFGAEVSSNATLTVLPALVSVQPQNLTTNGGATVRFSSTVLGQGPFTFQWQFNGTNLPGATNSTFTLANALVAQSGAYSLVACNSFGVATSPSAMLTVVPWITISISPTTITSGAGTLVAFSFNVGGLSPVTCQWTHNGNAWAGPNPGGSLQIIDPPMSWAGTYNVTASDPYATLTSSNATLTIIPAAITGQPQSRGAWVGGVAQLKVSAIGAAPLGYQWQFYGTNLPGANANPLTLTNVQPSQFGPYDVVVTNPYTNLVSATATLALSQVAVWGYSANGETNLPIGLTNIIGISGGAPSPYDCQALRSNGTVLTWPSTFPGIFLQPATNLIAIAGADPTFGLRSNGIVVEWPAEASGVVPGISNVVAVAAFGNYCLALKTNGTVVAASGTPAPAASLSNVVAIALGSGHGLALKLDGTVTAWGNNSAGQATVPTGLSNVVAIAAGGLHSLALKRDGTLAGWGSSAFGQAIIPPALSNVVAIAAGWYFSLALRADGTVAAWGQNAYGLTNVPSGLTNVVSIAAGQYNGMALIGPGPPVAEAVLTNPSLGPTGFRVFLPTQSGRVYGLEYKNSLTDDNWTLLPLIPGNGGMGLLTDPSATNMQRFYRAQRW